MTSVSLGSPPAGPPSLGQRLSEGSVQNAIGTLVAGILLTYLGAKLDGLWGWILATAAFVSWGYWCFWRHQTLRRRELIRARAADKAAKDAFWTAERSLHAYVVALWNPADCVLSNGAGQLDIYVHLRVVNKSERVIHVTRAVLNVTCFASGQEDVNARWDSHADVTYEPFERSLMADQVYTAQAHFVARGRFAHPAPVHLSLVGHIFARLDEHEGDSKVPVQFDNLWLPVKKTD